MSRTFYKSPAWRKARAAYIDRRIAIDGGLCEVCGREPGKIVHHIVWLTDDNESDPAISLSETNLRYECQTCHNQEDNELSPRGSRRYSFDKDGNIVPK